MKQLLTKYHDDYDSRIQEFKQLLRGLARVHTELWIEKECYRQMALERDGITEKNLLEKVAVARSLAVSQPPFMSLWESLSERDIGLLVTILLCDTNSQ